MSASSTQICNLALARIGGARIDSLSDGSTEANWCNELYPLAREFVTADALWRHAKVFANLAETTNDREDDWGYKYVRPSDCVRLWHLLPETGPFDRQNPVRFETLGDAIYTDEPAARAFYLQIVTDTSKFTPSFVTALAWYLAHLLVQPLRKDTKLMADALQGYAIAKANAIAVDAAEQMYIPTADEALPDWMAARNG